MFWQKKDVYLQYSKNPKYKNILQISCIYKDRFSLQSTATAVSFQTSCVTYTSSVKLAPNVENTGGLTQPLHPQHPLE